jgi:hypothetical protein
VDRWGERGGVVANEMKEVGRRRGEIERRDGDGGTERRDRKKA